MLEPARRGTSSDWFNHMCKEMLASHSCAALPTPVEIQETYHPTEKQHN